MAIKALATTSFARLRFMNKRIAVGPGRPPGNLPSSKERVYLPHSTGNFCASQFVDRMGTSAPVEGGFR